MGLTSWFAGRYFLKETQRLDNDLRSLSRPDREQALEYLLQRMGTVVANESAPGNALENTLRQVVTEETRERQRAVAMGANNSSDPEWLKHALVETWAVALMSFCQGRIAWKYYNRVNNHMMVLVADTLGEKAVDDFLKEHGYSGLS